MLTSILSVIKEIGKSVQTTEIDYSGYSGKKIIYVLQKLAALFSANTNTCYLEIGVFQGLTLLSVAATVTDLTCYGIDNFAYFDPEHKNFDIVKNRIRQNSIENAFIINQDYEDALENLGDHIGNKKVGIYFIDGPHDYRSQLMCLELALPYLHENAVIIVDDSNYNHVRQANRDFLLTHQKYKLVFEAYTRIHPQNMGTEEENDARNGWWNGINIIVNDPNGHLEAIYPPTERNRILFENEHVIHSSNMAIFTPQSLDLLNAIYDKKPMQVIRIVVQLMRSFRQNKRIKSLFRFRNTFSETLDNIKTNCILKGEK